MAVEYVAMVMRVSFGNPATSMRPVALRPQLALGLPLSRGRFPAHIDPNGVMRDSLRKISSNLSTGRFTVVLEGSRDMGTGVPVHEGVSCAA